MGTSLNLVHKKVTISWHDREIIASIDSLSLTYPETAYLMTWTKKDNPGENIPLDCAGICSAIHHKQIKKILN